MKYGIIKDRIFCKKNKTLRMLLLLLVACLLLKAIKFLLLMFIAKMLWNKIIFW